MAPVPLVSILSRLLTGGGGGRPSPSPPPHTSAADMEGPKEGGAHVPESNTTADVGGPKEGAQAPESTTTDMSSTTSGTTTSGGGGGGCPFGFGNNAPSPPPPPLFGRQRIQLLYEQYIHLPALRDVRFSLASQPSQHTHRI